LTGRDGRDDSHAVPTSPLAPGSISLRVYPLDLPPDEVVREIQAQGRLAEEAGFDGCMTSEHHGGFPNYLPNPLLAATWLLEATERMWAAPCPIVLALRPVAQVIEDIAWTYHRFPGRVGIGVCAGALPVDFEMAGVPFEEMFPRYRAALAELAAALGGKGEGPIAADPAVAVLAGGEIPVAAAVQAVKTAERAARLGASVLYDSLQTIERTKEMSDAYRAAGGTGTRILIRRVWVGDPPFANMKAQMDRFRGITPERTQKQWGAGDDLIAGDDGDEVAERVHSAMVQSGADAVNLRVFLAGLSPGQVRGQLERHGAETLPRLRGLLASV
jgi:alkanesulfonate monooxygenase SsuD/methylene tetrahydromethanopterin reductase-like flavin-dependent oxidoreductase (luciferase family)